jgi:hypothetical protein
MSEEFSVFSVCLYKAVPNSDKSLDRASIFSLIFVASEPSFTSFNSFILSSTLVFSSGDTFSPLSFNVFSAV